MIRKVRGRVSKCLHIMMKMHQQVSPSSLIVMSLAQIVTVVVTASNANGHGLAADQFPSSEEETTPGGGIKELVVGHVRKIVRLNNAQLVIPDLAPTPPNIVAGCSLNSIHVRCQGKIFDNN